MEGAYFRREICVSKSGNHIVQQLKYLIQKKAKAWHWYELQVSLQGLIFLLLGARQSHSPDDNAIAVRTKVEGTDKKEVVVGHVPEPLAQILGPMLKDETKHCITAKITGEKRGAPEGVWVQGGGIELPCRYFLYRPKESKARVRSALRKQQ